MSRSFIDCKHLSILSSTLHGPSSIAELLVNVMWHIIHWVLSQTYLAHSANLPEGLYILLALISSFLFFFNFFFTMSKAISVSIGPIFTIFSPNGSYLHEFSWSGPVFPIPQGTLPWQPILCRSGLVRWEPKYLRIRWTDFHNLCTIIMVGIELQMINPTFFFRYLKGRCHLPTWLRGLRLLELQCSEPGWLVRQGVGSSPAPAGMSSEVSACHEIILSILSSTSHVPNGWNVTGHHTQIVSVWVWWEPPVWTTDSRG